MISTVVPVGRGVQIRFGVNSSPESKEMLGEESENCPGSKVVGVFGELLVEANLRYLSFLASFFSTRTFVVLSCVELIVLSQWLRRKSLSSSVMRPEVCRDFLEISKRTNSRG